MQKSKRFNCFIVAELAFLVLWTMVIWGHSMMPPAVSTAESDWVAELLRKILPFELPFSIRKIAHFSEFAVYGAAAFLVFGRMFGLRFQTVINALFAGLLTAVTDEFIQVFTGRGSAVPDVVLDFCGCLFGVLLCCWLNCVFLKRAE